MAYIDAGPAAALPPESAMEVEADGRLYAVAHTGGRFFALDGVCPHAGGPLGQGQIHDGHLVCPYHLWAVECATGRFGADPAERVATFEVVVEEGRIRIGGERA